MNTALCVCVCVFPCLASVPFYILCDIGYSNIALIVRSNECVTEAAIYYPSTKLRGDAQHFGDVNIAANKEHCLKFSSPMLTRPSYRTTKHLFTHVVGVVDSRKQIKVQKMVLA